jgi:hypothetical protein
MNVVYTAIAKLCVAAKLICAGRLAVSRALDMRTKKEQNEPGTQMEVWLMYRFARESLALASVVGFVWMICQAAQLAG